MVSESFWELMLECMYILMLEIIIDWTKHAFITRFNEINLSVYNDYLLSLAYDTVQSYDKKVNICGYLYWPKLLNLFFKNHFVFRLSLITRIWWQDEWDLSQFRLE